ncbi:hypothetical protein Tco_1064491, partial [Tanacetum coccineum]
MPSFPSPEPKVSCFDDLDLFKDFENEFPAIVYNDALTSKSDFLTEPTLSPQHIDEFDLKDETTFPEYDEVEQNVLYFNDLFHFNIIYLDNLKSDKDNDDNEINIIQSSRDNNKMVKIYNLRTDLVDFADMALPPRDQRHQYLRFEGLQYTDTDIMDFEERLGRIYNREVYSLAELEGGYLRLEACWLIACNIAGRSQAPEKVTVTDLFYPRGMDVGSVNISYLLARYLRLFASGRKHGAMISGGLPVIDMGELVKLQIFEELNDTWDWAPQPPPAARPSRTMAQRLARVEEEVHEIRGALGEQHEVMDIMARDLSRFTVWAAEGISQLLNYAGATY